MANSDKNILITPNTGNTAEPTIAFTGANNTPVTLRVLDDGTLSFEGGVGQLFSISNSMTGQIFSVNDISGLPSLEVYSNGQVNIAPYGGNIALGSATSTVVLSGNLVANAPFAVVNTTANVIYAAANGNVGIGIATPTHPLHIDDNGTTGRGLLITGGGGGGNLLTLTRDVGATGVSVTFDGADSQAKARFAGSSNAMMVGTNSTGTLLRVSRNFTSSNDGLSVSLSGNVGINNTVPTHSLSVNGDAFIQSSLNVSTTFASGNATITGFANIVGNAQISDTLTGNNVVITGNLTVSGTTTYVNTAVLNVSDNIITLNADWPSGSAPTENSGFEVNRGTSPNTSFYWDETNDSWVASPGNDANNAFRIVSNTYTRVLSMVAGGLVDAWGNTTDSSAFMSVSVASGVNKQRNYNRDYLIANTGSDNAVFAANSNIGLGNTTPTHKVSVGGTMYVAGVVNAAANVQFENRISVGNTTTVPLANAKVLIEGGITQGLLVNRQATYTLNANAMGSAVAKFVVSPYSTTTNGHIALGSVHSPTSNGFNAVETRLYLTSNASGSYQSGITTSVDANNDGVEDFNVRIMEWTSDSQSTTTLFSNNVARVFIAANGNVGIANNTPDSTLEVNGRIRAVGNGTAAAIQLVSGVGSSSYISIVPAAGIGAYNTLVSAGDNLIFASNSTQNNGNLVIGTWTSYTGGYGIKLVGNTYHTQIQGNTFAVSNGSANGLVVYANNFVAIGNTTSLPVTPLQVVITTTASAGNPIATFGTGTERSRLRILDENSTGQIPPTISSNTAAWGLGLAAEQGASAPIIFYTGGTANTTNEKVRISGNGNVGIANTAPGSKLVVNGETLSGSFRTGNNVVNGAITATLSSTTQTSVDTTAQSATKSLKYLVEVTRGTEYQISEMLIVANTSLAILTEYAIVHTSALPLVSYDADVSGGNIRLLATSSNTTSTSLKLFKTTFV